MDVATTPLRDAASPVVLSFGLGDDVSFDEAMISTYRALGFDPAPASLRWLADHGVPAGMRVEPIGIAAFDGEQAFAMLAGETRGNFSSKQCGDTTVICQVRRYAAILAMLGLRRVDVLKLDVEGAEYDVIDDLLASRVLPAQLLVEVHHRLHNIYVAQTRQSVRAIQRAGFSLVAVSPAARNSRSFGPDIRGPRSITPVSPPSAQMMLGCHTRAGQSSESSIAPASIDPQVAAEGSDTNPSSVSTEGIQAWQIKSL